MASIADVWVTVMPNTARGRLDEIGPPPPWPRPGDVSYEHLVSRLGCFVTHLPVAVGTRSPSTRKRLFTVDDMFPSTNVQALQDRGSDDSATGGVPRPKRGR